MIKQYSLHEDLWPWWHINLYHNGKSIKTIKTDFTIMDRDIKNLEDNGYTRGYTKAEVWAEEKKLRIQKHRYERYKEREIVEIMD